MTTNYEKLKNMSIEEMAEENQIPANIFFEILIRTSKKDTIKFLSMEYEP